MLFKRSRLAGCFLGMFCLILSGANFSALAQNSDQKIELVISPKVCQVAASGDTCALNINVLWQAKSPINSCLFQDEQQLMCWTKQQKVSTSFAVQFTQNSHFMLFESDKLLAQQILLIESVQATKFRRRLRADWSLF